MKKFGLGPPGVEVADRLGSPEIATIEPYLSDRRRHVQLAGAGDVAQFAFVSTPAVLPRGAAVAESAVDDKREDFWAGVDDCHDVVLLSGRDQAGIGLPGGFRLAVEKLDRDGAGVGSRERDSPAVGVAGVDQRFFGRVFVEG